MAVLIERSVAILGADSTMIRCLRDQTGVYQNFLDLLGCGINDAERVYIQEVLVCVIAHRPFAV